MTLIGRFKTGSFTLLYLTYSEDAFAVVPREFRYRPKRSQDPPYTLSIALHVVLQTWRSSNTSRKDKRREEMVQASG